VVSGAAGAVGSHVSQIAKIKGNYLLKLKSEQNVNNYCGYFYIRRMLMCITYYRHRGFTQSLKMIKKNLKQYILQFEIIKII